LTQLAAGYTPQQRVVSFLGSVLREVFPCEFWGSERNFQSIMASVESFVHLRRKERLANKNLMHSIKVTHIKWLYPAIQSVGPGKKKPRSSQDTATALTLTMLRWVFQGFIIPLLRTNFYVTDTEFSANQVHYYRKPVWSLFRSLSVGKVLGGNHFREISFEKALGLIKEHQLGISKLRLLPKTTGVRPIAQLSRRQTVSFLVETVNSSKSTSSRKRANDRAMGLNTICPAKRTRIEEKSPMQRQKTTSSEQTSTPLLPRFPPTNLVLGDVLDVLRYECSSRMNPFGVGIDSLDFFHSQYREYIGLIKQTRGHNVLNLTFASVDIEKCFDRIHQDTLLKFVNDLLSHDGYVIQQIRLHDGTDRCANAFRIKRIAEPLDAYHPIHDGCKSLMVRSNRCIFDLFKSTLVDRRDLVRLLEEHIKDNMIVTSGRYRKKVLHQWTGISQGSSLSTILCNIYYGNMEKIMFVDFPLDQHDFMSRFVDDFLFVSTDEEKVKRFLHSSYRGIPELGVEVNGDKSAVSAKIEVVSSCGETICLSNGCRKGYNGRALFPWCGLLFDPETGAVSTDYQRFFQGRPRNSLTVDCDGQEGTRMEYRIQGFVFPRCLPILFDPVINCFEHTIMNFFQMMLFAAVKTAEYLRSLETLTSSRQRNALHVLRCIKVLPPYAIQTINGRLNSVLKQGGRRVNTAVSPRLATWLTWKGFHVVFASLSPEFTDLEQSIFDNLQPLGSVKISAKQVEIVSAAVSRGLDSMCLHRLIRKAY
jgi:telomerase reverse transcriptase